MCILCISYKPDQSTDEPTFRPTAEADKELCLVGTYTNVVTDKTEEATAEI